MAMANWAFLALNEKNELTNGRFTSPSGVMVEIYKNWPRKKYYGAIYEFKGWFMRFKNGGCRFSDKIRKVL